MKFLLGFVAGLLAKEKLIYVSLKLLPNAKYKKEKVINGVFEVKLVLEVSNVEYFNELYPDAKNSKEYTIFYDPNKIIFNSTNIKKICECSNKDHSFKHLSRCGDLRMYIKYNKFTNVYSVDDTIDCSDFIFSPKIFYNRFKNVVCATLSDSTYVTAEFKRYFNQPDTTLKLTPKILFNKPLDLILLNENGLTNIKNEQVI
jgi:hypothetical protein